MTIDFGDIIAFCALCLAAYSTKKTYDFNRRQKEILEIQDSLNKLLLRKEEKDAIDTYRADISATFIKIGSNKHRLKVFNRGKGTAKNVRIEFPEGNELIIQSDVEDKFPAPTMEQHENIELIAAPVMRSPRRITVKLTWDDDEKPNKSKVIFPTL